MTRNAKEMKDAFERKWQPSETTKLTFDNIEGFDVYNCSQPFLWHNKQYIYGRVEKREEWMRSWVRLFEHVSNDHYKLVDHSMIYQLEDPYIAMVDDQLVLGGTHVRVDQEDHLAAYYGYFYKGTDLEDLKFFTSGPENMKDIRICQLLDGRIAVFSRPRNTELIKSHGSESLIGFTIIESLDDLSPEVIETAQPLDDLFGPNEWGGVNQANLLDSGLIGIIGHLSFKDKGKSVYMVISFVLNPGTREVFDHKVIATRKSFEDGPAKKDYLTDCCFPSGIVCDEKGNCDLYSGIGDVEEGKVRIPYPFEGYGAIKRAN